MMMAYNQDLLTIQMMLKDNEITSANSAVYLTSVRRINDCAEHDDDRFLNRSCETIVSHFR